MSARILDGNALAATVRERLALRAAALKVQGLIPALAVILVGDDGASAVYVRNKVAACEKTGVDRKSTRLNSSHLRLSRMPSSA